MSTAAAAATSVKTPATMNDYGYERTCQIEVLLKKIEPRWREIRDLETQLTVEGRTTPTLLTTIKRRRDRRQRSCCPSNIPLLRSCRDRWAAVR